MQIEKQEALWSSSDMRTFRQKFLTDKNGKPYHSRGFWGHADHYAGFTNKFHIKYEINSRIFEDYFFWNTMIPI